MKNWVFLLPLASLISACGTMRETSAVRDDVYDIPDRTAIASVTSEPEPAQSEEPKKDDDYYDPGTAKSYGGRDYYDVTYNDPYWYNQGRFGFGYDQWNPGYGTGMGMNYGYGSPYGSGYGYDPYWNNSWQSGYGAWGSGYNGWNSSGWGWGFSYGSGYGYPYGNGGYGGSCWSCGYGGYGYGGYGGGWGPYQGPYGSCNGCYSPVDYGTTTIIAPRPTMTGSSGNNNTATQTTPRMQTQNPASLMRPEPASIDRRERNAPSRVDRPDRERPNVTPQRERPRVERERPAPVRTEPSDGGGGRNRDNGGGGGGNNNGGGGNSPTPRPRR